MMTSPPKKIAFVVPRYVTSSAGGAETACRKLAESLSSLKGASVEILTTCAEDHFTWKNVHPEGAAELNGVTVRRFPADERRDTGRFARVCEKLSYRKALTAEEEKVFFDNNLNSSSLYRFIDEKQEDYSCFIFMPYLFGLTVNGARRVPEKAVLIPCLHDEPYARLATIRRLLESCRAIICNSPPEKDLVLRLSAASPSRVALGGIIVDPLPDADGAAALEKKGIRAPYLFYCGRREGGKNFDLLLEMFREYRKQSHSLLQLVTAGSGTVDIRPSEKTLIIDAGFVEESLKAALYRNALLTCQPSTKESFSIVIMESWLEKRPVLVNSRASVTRYWTELCGGGFSFKNFFEFEEILNFCLGNGSVLDRMGEAGRAFTLKNFNRRVIADRLYNALSEFGFVLK